MDKESLQSLPFSERVKEWRETLAVKWFMLDAQQKEAVIIFSVTILDRIVEIIVARINKGSKKTDAV